MRLLVVTLWGSCALSGCTPKPAVNLIGTWQVSKDLSQNIAPQMPEPGLTMDLKGDQRCRFFVMDCTWERKGNELLLTLNPSSNFIEMLTGDGKHVRMEVRGSNLQWSPRSPRGGNHPDYVFVKTKS